MATAGAAQVLGPDHGVTKALAKAAITMAPADLWQARLAVMTLRRDQREAIAEVAESRHGQHHLPLPGGGLVGAVLPHRKTCRNCLRNSSFRRIDGGLPPFLVPSAQRVARRVAFAR